MKQNDDFIISIKFSKFHTRYQFYLRMSLAVFSHLVTGFEESMWDTEMASRPYLGLYSSV
jgi:hypothetical protein